MEAYNIMGCRVMNVGVNDLAAGKDFILELRREAKFPFISANIIDKQKRQALFPPYEIIETPLMKIGFVGVTVGGGGFPDFSFADPITTVKKYVAQIRPEVDVVVILANVNDRLEQRLANIEGVDFIVRSRTPRLSSTPMVINHVNVLRLGNRGKYAGIVHLREHHQGRYYRDISSKRNRLKFIQRRLARLKKEIPAEKTLEEYYQDNPTRLRLVKNLKGERDKLLKQLGEKANTFWFETVGLDKKIADDPQIDKLLNDVRQPKSKTE